MAKACDVTGKKTLIGNRRKHKHSEGWKFRAQTTSRTWKPNLRKATVSVDGKKQKMTLSMKAYKKLSKEGKIVK